MQEKLKPRSDIISSMFFSACIAMIFTAAAGVVAHTVDGIIASRFLGTNTYSAISLLRPFSSALTMLAGFISTGCQVVTSRLIGTGKKRRVGFGLFHLCCRSHRPLCPGIAGQYGIPPSAVFDLRHFHDKTC